MDRPVDRSGVDRSGVDRSAVDRSGLEAERDERTGRSAASERVRHQARWVDLQVQEAMRRGEFDDLPGAGKPLDLPDKHDPDWWVKQLIEREKITGIAPPAIALRLEDAELDAQLDREPNADGVRRVVTDFNARVVEARRQLLGGPPVITPTRDVEAEVAAWQDRRAARRTAARLAAEQADSDASSRGSSRQRDRRAGTGNGAGRRTDALRRLFHR